MRPAFTVRPLAQEDRPVVECLWQLYRHDLSEFRGTHGPAGFRGMLPGEDGTFRPLSQLPEEDADRAAYAFHSGVSPVGFAFVAHLSGEARLMSEFFIVRGLRRYGFGRTAVAEIFALHPGRWEIPFQESNDAAARFWRRVVAEAGGDSFREERRPVLGQAEVPPDVWITIDVR
jgi:predicted acetyltransferase